MTTTTTMTLPEQIRRMDGERLRAYADNLAFYNGDQWPAAMLRSRNRRLVFNYAKAIVDKTASYLMTGVNVAVDPEDETAEAHARAVATERALLAVYEQNNLDQLDFDTEIDAAILGDAAYKVTWDAAERRVRVTAPDVQGLFAWWAGDDVSRVWRVASRYMLDAESAREMYGAKADGGRAFSSPVVANGHRNGSTTSQPGTAVPHASSASPPRGLKARATEGAVEIVEVWTADAFEIWVGGERVEARENPYGFIPYVLYPNIREPKKFWGASDLPPIKEPVRELNRALTQLSMILELSGNPIAVLENVSESADIAVVPGAVWELPERARAYLLDLLQGGGVKLHADYVDLVYRALHDLGESPRTSFGENRAGLSGIALNVELDPLLKKVARKRLIRGAAYRRRNEMILRILERYAEPRPSYAPYRSRIAWGSVLPLDRSRQVEDERTLVASGIHSRRRAADNLGVGDPESEFTRWLEERRLMGGVEAGS